MAKSRGSSDEDKTKDEPVAAEIKPKHSTSTIRSRDEGARSRDFMTNEHKLRGKRGKSAFGLVYVSQ